MINWPTAFVIAVAICAGAFLYNKPSDAAFGGSQGGAVALTQSKGPLALSHEWIQFDGNKQRHCYFGGGGPSGIKCKSWKTD